jgi:hypothetical protein
LLLAQAASLKILRFVRYTDKKTRLQQFSTLLNTAIKPIGLNATRAD